MIATRETHRTVAMLGRASPVVLRCAAWPLRPCARHGWPTKNGHISTGQNSMPCSSSRRLSATAIEVATPHLRSDQAAQQKKRILSGVQPTGRLHLGNYFGAIRNWVGLQDAYENYFVVVDLHAITVPHDPVELRSSTRSMAASYIAAGIDPAKCVTPIGWLNRMIQFKEKSIKQGEDVRAGLLTYPVLMAADILLYQSDLVPVGEDQKQHLELTRDIAERCNFMYGGKQWKKRGGRGGSIFKVPEIFVPPAGARVMSLQDGTAKMSKSAENDASRINLTDDSSVIASKVKRCKTDALVGLEWGNPDRPECTNLLTLYQLATGQSKDEVLAEAATLRWGDFKPLLADALVEHLRPIQAHYKELTADPAYIDSVLATGADAARVTAERTLANLKDAMGMVAAF